MEHLQWLWDKKQLPEASPEEIYRNSHSDDAVDMYCKTRCGNPLELVKKFEQMAMKVQRDYLNGEGRRP